MYAKRNGTDETNDLRTMRVMLGVLVACQVFQALAVGIGAFVVGPQAYAIVVEARTFVDPSTQAAFDRIVHDLEVVTRDLNLVETHDAEVARRLDSVDAPATFHSIFAAAGRVTGHVEAILPALKSAAGALASVTPDDGDSSLPHLLGDARRAASRAATLLESDAPTEALELAREMSNQINAMLLVMEPNGTVAQLLQSTARLVPQISEALDEDVVRSTVGAWSSTWSKSLDVLSYAARTLQEE